MEVGPLSRMLVAYVAGNTNVKGLVDSTLATLSNAAGATLTPAVLMSLLGRVAARNL